MVLIAQIWIKHHPKAFVYLRWFNRFIIKVYNWVQWGSLLDFDVNSDVNKMLRIKNLSQNSKHM